ncbi:hypothetical protein CRENBAI_025371 [Crenichthys baileyi]|uniref:Pentraxin family member n=1 Tax=Crenichthys baileyi TaxID=28760 RepID=A0AAV9RHQ1_9TELE
MATNFEGLDLKLNKWHSICATWDSTSGVVQLWLDGEPSNRKFASSGSNINGPIIVALGQDQDTHGGGFDAKQSFVGMMSDVHMWDYKLSSYGGFASLDDVDNLCCKSPRFFTDLSKAYSLLSLATTISDYNFLIYKEEQDSYGGGFDSQQSFVGMMSYIHLWDYVLSPCEIQRYVDNLNFTPGNVLNLDGANI